MDFTHDQLEDVRCFRLFNVIDDFNREALGIKIDFFLPTERVVRLKQIIEWRGRPVLTQWMYGYNHDRLNMALSGITQKQRLAMVA